MLDPDGFRANVGIIVCNPIGKLLWTKRVGLDAWQFPQGGLRSGESFEEAMYRELREEVGLTGADVSILKQTRGWLRYRLPAGLIRREAGRRWLGQKQKWFLLSLDSDESRIQLDGCEPPEFDAWRWTSYWEPARQVVPFKRDVYLRALTELRAAHGQYLGTRPRVAAGIHRACL